MSIRRYLVLTLVSILTLITFIAAIQGYKASMVRAEKLFEQQLVDFAHIVKGLHLAFDNQVASAINHPTTTKVQQPLKLETSFAFQVWQENHLIIQSTNSPAKPIMSLEKSFTHFGEVNFSGQRWRAIYLSNDSTDLSHSNTAVEPSDKNLIVIVAQPLDKQFLLAQDVILAAVTPMIIAIILLSFLIYGIITQGLKPLHQLTTALANKQSHDFTPLALTVNNSELTRVVTTLNKLFERLNLAFERERHFAADAAHELKTPLSVLKINVHNLSQNLNDLQPKGSINLIKPLTVSVDRMGHVIDQILHLNRSNPEQIYQSQKRIKLKPLLQTVIADLYQAIANKQQTITLKANDIALKGDQISLQLMLTNLISNANKYTPNNGEIIVSVKCVAKDDKQPFIHKNINQAINKKTHQIIIAIEDSGQGIAEEEYHRVFDRFYRIGGDQHDSTVVGCGLGLTIVKHIVDIHRGSIVLSHSRLLGGLHVEVVFEQNMDSTIGLNTRISNRLTTENSLLISDKDRLNNKDECA